MTCPSPGTAEGLARHRKRHEQRCEECVKLSGRPWSRRRRDAEDIEHGTYAGYQIERLRKLDPCDACTAANRDYTRLHRQRTTKNLRTGCSKGLGWPLEDPTMARIGRVA